MLARLSRKTGLSLVLQVSKRTAYDVHVFIPPYTEVKISHRPEGRGRGGCKPHPGLGNWSIFYPVAQKATTSTFTRLESGTQPF